MYWGMGLDENRLLFDETNLVEDEGICDCGVGTSCGYLC